MLQSEDRKRVRKRRETLRKGGKMSRTESVMKKDLRQRFGQKQPTEEDTRV